MTLSCHEAIAVPSFSHSDPYPLMPLYFRYCRSSGVLGRSNFSSIAARFSFPRGGLPQGGWNMKNDRTRKPKSVDTGVLNGEAGSNEEKYRLILDSISDAVYKINPEGFFTYLNDTALKRTGLTPETYPTCHYMDLVVPDHHDLVRDRFERVMNGGANPPYELHVKARNGSSYVVEVQSKPIFENGSVVEMLGISRDITVRKQAEELLVHAKALLERMVEERTGKLARKSARLEKEIERRKIVAEKLRESEDRYRAIFENTGTAMLIVEEDNTISLVNTEFEKMSGYSRQDVEALKKWTDFMSEADALQMRSVQGGKQGISANSSVHLEGQAIDRFGQIRDVFATLSRIPGTKERIVSLLDITERKLSEQTLRKREEELGAKTRELEEVNTALKVLLKRREEDRKETEERVTSNIQDRVLPHLAKLKKRLPGARERLQINTIESSLKGIISPFTRKLSSRMLNLTPKEIQVANLIRDGKTTKEIAEHLDVSKSAIDTHRHHIRKKLGLRRKRVNLTSYLHSLS
jgi:PAS domain S-box-containing protein